jgi:shikimate kinase
MNLALIGFMGTGKTTIGKLIASQLQREFYDSDELIEKTSKLSITDIFALKGEQFFREIESQIIADLSIMNDIVISCGGGVVLNQKNIEKLRKNAILINLTASPETIYERVKNDSNRPIIKSDNILNKIKSLLEQRQNFYKNSDFSFETDSIMPQDLASLIIKTVLLK